MTRKIRARPVFEAEDTAVTVFNVGDFPVNVGEIFGSDPGLPRYFSPRAMAKPAYLPSNSMFISSGKLRVIVDPGNVSPDSLPKVMPAGEHQPPYPLLDQLAATGVDPSGVTDVVVTHLHTDHFSGATRAEHGKVVLAFPNARHIIPKKDWWMPDILEARRRGDKEVTVTLGVVEVACRLQFLDGTLKLGGGVSIEPSPGESPGHQMVAVSAEDKRCYCIGDLYHVREEVEHPELVAVWVDRAQLIESRRGFAERASKESALVLPGHMRPGRITLMGKSPKWSEA